ncbi:MAG: nucleoside kinase [Bacteroidaceae bacterium]|nr:nucleoside kinase [Bacteroidaceae bacterium]
MNDYIKILCKNNKKTINVQKGTSLFDIYQHLNIKLPYQLTSAKVNNKEESLDYRVYKDKEIEFLDVSSSTGNRTYCRSLFFVLSKAIHDIYPHSNVVIDIPMYSRGYYCTVNIGHPITTYDIEKVKKQMQCIIKSGIPFKRVETLTADVIKVFKKNKDESKVKLLKSIGDIYSTYYDLDGYVDFYYGTLLSNTSQLYLFDLKKYDDGILLCTPSRTDPLSLEKGKGAKKLFEMFREQHHWQNLLGLSTVGSFNEAVDLGYSTSLINVSEALQEKKISQIADMIAAKKGVKVVLISGPSSSGKTTFAKRLSIQLLVCGKYPVPISLDDYFLDRDKNPIDENGEYDYESLYALDLDLLNRQLSDLFAGKTIQLPKYNFQEGKLQFSDRKLKLRKNDILILEGIHALNPELTSGIAERNKFRVYASALTTLLLDDHNYIPTTDTRLLRRMIRDAKYRGTSATDTIKRWPSVRAGENKWIFPYQENADVMFNTALLFEIAVIKQQALDLLESVPENKEEYSEAYRLKEFLSYFRSIDVNKIPPTSLIREFIGGSSFKY